MAINHESRSLNLRHVRLKGMADGRCARLRLESALSVLDFASCGLPPRALLVVKRVAPMVPLRSVGERGDSDFGRAVEAELKLKARQAIRPWVDVGSIQAVAVLFADEAELAACLVRDWLHGTLSGCWWARSVLDGVSLPQWWRRDLLPRGDLLPPVVEHLAAQAVASDWVARLNDGELAVATAAVVDSHGLTAIAEDTGGGSSGSATWPSRIGRADKAAEDKAADELVRIVPEVQLAGGSSPARQFIAVTLGLQRAPAWTRSGQFVLALRSMGPTPLVRQFHHRVLPIPREASTGPTRARADEAMAGTPDPGLAGAEPEVQRLPAAAKISVYLRDQYTATDVDPVVAPVQHVLQGPMRDQVADLADGDALVPNAAQPSAWVNRSPWPQERPLVAGIDLDPPSIHAISIRSIETDFGGLFYLLNPALALGLYGDFTQPRHPGIALSPWDWLALIGRTWFGRPIVRDPVWGLLAHLAGRPPGQAPGSGFAPPRDWSVPSDWPVPWGLAQPLEVQTRGGRLRLRHPAGFLLADLPRVPGLAPLVQARDLCGRWPALGEAGVRPLARTCKNASQTLCAGTGENRVLARWLGRLLPYLKARLTLALGAADPALVPALVCRHPARVHCSATALDLHLSLDELPIELRIAGLDRDPGWIPAADRSVAFHFA